MAHFLSLTFLGFSSELSRSLLLELILRRQKTVSLHDTNISYECVKITKYKELND